MGVVGPIPVMAHLYGLTPALGSTGLLIVVCSFIVLHQSFYIASINIGGSMVPDIADDMALQTGLRQEGIINSGIMLTQKMTFGLGAFFAGLAIDFAGLQGVTEASQMTGEMMRKLAWVYGPGLTVVTFIVALIYTRYPLSRSRVEKVRQQLDAAQERALDN